jgi:pimeloyl-ACP methyl ester carboxylesterase
MMNLFFLILLQTIFVLHLTAVVHKAQELKSETVSVGSCRFYTVGGGQGTKTVVFEAGMGEDSSTWKELQTIIAKSSRTFAYDRAGLGKSESSSGRRSAKEMAIELHNLLETAKIPGPYILVGHSLGAWIISIYAHLYPRDVAGIVLIDPAFRESGLQAKMSRDEWIMREKAISKYTGQMTDAQRLEKDALELSGEQAEKSFPLPDIPAILLSGILINPNFPGSSIERDVKIESHKKWISKKSNTEHILVENSRHYIHLERPAEVICAINQIIKKTWSR